MCTLCLRLAIPLLFQFLFALSQTRSSDTLKKQHRREEGKEAQLAFDFLFAVFLQISGLSVFFNVTRFVCGEKNKRRPDKIEIRLQFLGN